MAFQPLGSWWNPLSWFDSGNPAFTPNGYNPAAAGGQLPAGWSVLLPYSSGGDPVPGDGIDESGYDLNEIKNWTIQVKAVGHAPTRVPNDYTFAGELAAKTQGPGTRFPGGPIYVVAEQRIRDADHRIKQALASDQDNTILNAMKALGLAPGTPGNADTNWGEVAKWSAIGVGVLLVLPQLLPRRNPRGRR